jgi:hypothetical protein
VAAGRTDELNTGGARTVFEFTGVHAAKEASKGTFIGNISSVPDVGNARAERGTTNLSRGVPAWLIILVGLGIVGGGVAFGVLNAANHETVEAAAPTEAPAVAAPATPTVAPVVADPALPPGMPPAAGVPAAPGAPPAATPPAAPPAGTPAANTPAAPPATPAAPAPAPTPAPKPTPKKPAPKKPSAPAPAPAPAPKTIKPSKPAREGLDSLPKPP